MERRLDYGTQAKTVTVFGASGFVGRYLVSALADSGFRVRAVVRNPNTAHFLTLYGSVGQVVAVQANLRDDASIQRAIEGSHYTVNLVGILFERGKQTFKSIHVDGAKKIATFAQKHGSRHVYMSALGARANSPSIYAQTKFEAEEAVKAIQKETIVFRPSVIFGEEDQFFNRFANLLRVLPFFPLIGSSTRVQPVYVVDVTKAICRALSTNSAWGNLYEIGGPEVLTLRSLVSWISDVIDVDRRIIDVPNSFASILATCLTGVNNLSLGLLPYWMQVSKDQIHMLRRHSIVTDKAKREGRTIEAFGIHPKPFEIIMKKPLLKFKDGGQLSSQKRF